MKMSARGRAAFFKLCGKHAPLSVLCAPREFQWNSRAKTQAAARVDAFRSFLYDESVGRLAQLVRAPALQAGGRRFEPCTAHHPCAPPFRGDLLQFVRTLPCRWLESHPVTANSLPYSTERTGNRRIPIYKAVSRVLSMEGRRLNR